MNDTGANGYWTNVGDCMRGFGTTERLMGSVDAGIRVGGLTTLESTGKPGHGFVQHTNGVEGSFAKNKTDGMRRLCEGKRIYQGEWKNGKRHGKEESTRTHDDDDDHHWVMVYEGEYRRGQRHGHGKTNIRQWF